MNNNLPPVQAVANIEAEGNVDHERNTMEQVEPDIEIQPEGESNDITMNRSEYKTC